MALTIHRGHQMKFRSFSFVMFICLGVVLAGALWACSPPSSSSGGDVTPCTADTDCTQFCTAELDILLRNSDLSADRRLTAQVCNPDLCACGLADNGSCFVIGGVVGTLEEVACPADETKVNEIMDTIMAERAGAEGNPDAGPASDG